MKLLTVLVLALGLGMLIFEAVQLNDAMEKLKQTDAELLELLKGPRKDAPAAGDHSRLLAAALLRD